MTTFTLVGGSWALDALGNASDWQATSLKLTVSEDFMLSYTPLSSSATPHLPEAIQLGAAVGTLHNLHVGTDAIDLAPASTAGWTVRAGRMTYTSGNFTDFLILEQDPSAADPLGRVHFFRIGGQGATALTHTGDLSKLNRVTDLSAIPDGAVSPNTAIDLGTIPGIVTSLADSITGTQGSDTILGGLGKDWISGLGGHDKLDGGDGGDTILGGNGRDTILGQAHDDLLSATAGANFLSGGTGSDTITGGLFKDTIFGGDGLDVINGGLGADKINAGGGADTVTGTGEDLVNLGKGNDTYLLDAAYAGRAGDTVDGGKYNDLIDASASTMAVSLIGNTGSDTLYGGSADDTLEGNAGKDSLYAGNGNDSVLGGTGFDYAELGDGDDIYKDVNKGGADTVLAGDGDDTVRTLDGHDLIITSSGNNLIEAGLGQDTIRIGSGNDTAKAGLGNDLIEISGGTLNQIEAGNGSDTIVVQGGTSALNLGLGEDVIRLAFTDTANAGEQRVLDFNLKKDTIDLGPLADITAHWDGISNPFAALLSLEQDGADTLLRADFDGDGTADTTLLRIENRKSEKFTAAHFGGYEIVARPVAQDDRLVGDPIPEFQVNEVTLRTQRDPSITALDNGNFVVTWWSLDRQEDESSSGIRARIFGPDGNEVVSDFLVNSVTAESQVYPSITTLENGHFVAAWYSNDGVDDPDYSGIRARIFDADGNEFVPEFLVNEFTQDEQTQPSMAAIGNGQFVVTWLTREGFSPWESKSIQARIFNSDGSEAVSEFQVDTVSASDHRSPNVTALSTGQFVVTWSSIHPPEDADRSGVRARIFDADGTEAVSEFQVNTVTNGFQVSTVISALENGRFVVVWTSSDGLEDTSGPGIRARIFNADGSEAVPEFQVNEVTFASQYEPSVTTLADGRFAVVWQSDEGEDNSQTGIRGRIFNSDGSESVSEFQINEVFADFQLMPTITALDNGQFAVAWMSGDGIEDTSGDGIRARIFNADGTPVSDSRATADAPVVILASELLANDTDADGDTLVITSVQSTSANGATVTLDADGNVVYDPTSSSIIQALVLGDRLDDTFTYTISDGNGGSDTATVTITVSGKNGDPIAADDSLEGPDATTDPAYTDEDTVTQIAATDLLANDSDPDGHSLTISAVDATSANGATVTLDADGNLIYDPTTAAAIQALADGAFLEDTFTYTVSDGNGGTNTATVTIAVSGLDENTGPVAEDDTLGGTLTIPEFQVNEVTAGHQSEPVTANLSNDMFVVAWQSNDQTEDASSTGIRARILNSNGSEVVSEFLVNEITQNSQSHPSITVLSTGQFVVTWHSYDQTEDTSSTGVRARVFDADGTPAGDEFQVNEVLQNGQAATSIAALSEGLFVVAWWSLDQTEDTDGYGIRARIFNANGSEVVSEFQVNSTHTGSQLYPHVVSLSNGQFVVAWNSSDLTEDPSGNGIRARVFNADGSEAVTEFQVNSELTNHQTYPTITALENGQFAVIWHSLDQTEDTSGYGVRARIFNADGSEAVGEFQVNEVSNGNQYFGSTATLSNGQFVVTWFSDDLAEDTEGFGIRARVLNADGTEAVGEFQVNEVTTNNQYTPNVTALDNGQFVISWHSTDRTEDTDGHGIRARIFNADGSPATSALAHEDQVTTIDAADLLGNDTDADGDTLVILSVEATSTHGAALSLDADGNVVYDPTAASTLQALAAGDFLGDSFTYTVSDGQGSTDTATVSLTIAGLDETVGGAEENTDVLSW
ncbi:cadherin-like domain-containing protein [Shimia sp. CNT1-13L.2]|uniref:cadherin-like domain-containing protein n=1 Tax=Shimia sp. CNT1-13L.2 TaxID=2959663 RepID=UPI0020CBD77D|nr:cadherin-like domain-containing protein [Shimia sp. CNT1-13L.2]